MPHHDLPAAPLRKITAEEKALFVEHGAWPLRGVIPMEWIEHMSEAIDQKLRSPGPLGMDYNAKDSEGRFYGDLFTAHFDEAFGAFAFNSPLPAIAAQAMDVDRVRFFYDQLLVKEPGANTPTPWHIDLPYWPLRVSGSHKWGKMFRAAAFSEPEDDKKMTEDLLGAWASGEFQEIPEVDADPDRYTVLSWSMEPGDVLLHHPMTLHGSPGNTTQHARRRAIAMRYIGDDTTFQPGSDGRSMFDLVEAVLGPIGLKPGQKVGGPHFPQVWPR